MHRKNFKSNIGAALLCSTACIASPAFAADKAVSATDLEQLRQDLNAQRNKIAEQQRQLDAAERQLQEYKQTLRKARRDLDLLNARLGGGTQEPGTQIAQAQSGVPEVVGQAPDKSQETRPPQVAPIFEQPGILTPKGKYVLEPSLQYSYSSANRVSLVGYTIIPALVIGLIDVRSVNRSTWVGAVTGRYGLTNRLEVEAKIPYVYRNDDTVSRPIDLTPSAQDQVFNASGSGLGDIELGARYQLNDGGEDKPYYIAGLKFKTRTGVDPFSVKYASGTTAGTGTLQETLPTGSGFYAFQPSLSVIYPSDPVVFFGGVNYLWNIKRDVNKEITPGSFIGKVDPGDAFGFNVGMGLALNERASFSLGYEHTFIGRTKYSGAAAAGSTSTQLASLLLGYSYQLSDQTSINLSIGAGLTTDTPDAQITLRVPFSF
jgi:hypothetical protein